ncbi:MAG TPA: hypothetical protein VMU37_07935 [Caulobacteraceae bacterium]|nr:hypothetical protein [Caulobacteraceae bacterium]
MSPKRPDGPSFRAVGGDVVSRAGRVLAGSGLRLLADLGLQAMRWDKAGDAAAARCCALMAADLAAALATADDWRRAAAGCTASAFFSSVKLRDLARRANSTCKG